MGRERTRTRAGAATLSLLLVLGTLWPTRSAHAGPRGLSASELQRLGSGELVTRPVRERRGQLTLIGGSSWQVIEAPTTAVWRALLDTDHYHRMLPEVREARLVQQSATRRKVYLKHQKGFVSARYWLDVEIDASQGDIRFRIDKQRPSDLKGAWGLYALRPYGPERSLLAYRVMADVGDGLLGMLVQPLLHKWMLRVPWMIKRFVEGSGRHLYAQPTSAPR